MKNLKLTDRADRLADHELEFIALCGYGGASVIARDGIDGMTVYVELDRSQCEELIAWLQRAVQR